MNRFLKFAGCLGIAFGVLFFTFMMARVFLHVPEPPEEFIAAFLGGGAMGFCGCLILALNEIAMRRKNDS